MAVPKCKECEHHIQEHGTYSYVNHCHYCKEPSIEAERRSRNKYFELLPGETILPKEFRTSPKWCPLRKDGV